MSDGGTSAIAEDVDSSPERNSCNENGSHVDKTPHASSGRATSNLAKELLSPPAPVEELNLSILIVWFSSSTLPQH